MDDLLAEGQIVIPRTANLDLTWTTRSSSEFIRVLSERSTRVFVDEWRWQAAVPAQGQAAEDRMPTAAHTRDEYALLDVSVTANRFGALNEWRLQSSRGASNVVLPSVYNCTIQPQLPVPQIGTFPPTDKPPPPFSLLAVRCESGALRLSGAMGAGAMLSIYDAEIRIRAAGTELFLASGAFASRASGEAGGQVLYDNLVRVVSILPGPEARVSLDTLREVALAVPTLQWHGFLMVPPFAGKLEWGEQSIEDPTGTSRFDGTFLLVAQPPRLAAPGVEVMGVAAELAEADASPDLARPVAISVASLGLLAIAVLALTKLHIVGAMRRLLGIALFTRVTQDAALENPIRRSLMALVEENPGIRLTEAHNRLGMQRSTILHHVGILEDLRLIALRRQAGRVFLFPKGHNDVPDLEAKAFLERPLVRAVLTAITDCETCTQAGLARRMGSSQQTLSRILRRLEWLRAIQRVRIARGTSYAVLARTTTHESNRPMPRRPSVAMGT